MNKKGSALLIGLVIVLVIGGGIIALTSLSGGDSKEKELTKVAEGIPQELSFPIKGEKVLSENFNVQGDSLSGSYESRTKETLDFNQLATSFRNFGKGWDSGDISSGGDSFDGTFEKRYPQVTIDGKKYIPEASVTLSITVEDDGYTYINYDIDVTLEEVGAGTSSSSSVSIETSSESEDEDDSDDSEEDSDDDDL